MKKQVPDYGWLSGVRLQTRQPQRSSPNLDCAPVICQWGFSEFSQARRPAAPAAVPRSLHQTPGSLPAGIERYNRGVVHVPKNKSCAPDPTRCAIPRNWGEPSGPHGASNPGLLASNSDPKGESLAVRSDAEECESPRRSSQCCRYFEESRAGRGPRAKPVQIPTGNTSSRQSSERPAPLLTPAGCEPSRRNGWHNFLQSSSDGRFRKPWYGTTPVHLGPRTKALVSEHNLCV